MFRTATWGAALLVVGAGCTGQAPGPAPAPTDPPPLSPTAGFQSLDASSPAWSAGPRLLPWSELPAQTVTLSGEIRYAGRRSGPVRVEVLGAEGRAPGLLQRVELEGPGPWTTQAPARAGEVQIIAFLVDQADPQRRSAWPAGRLPTPTRVRDQDLGGLDIEIVDDPDLGDLAPGDPPDRAATAPTLPPGGPAGAP
ncbi:hypothetical protein L6R53_17610 [Myxococcota bacterium]|nr:hypothetical protein [Myxococcota bacterium]